MKFILKGSTETLLIKVPHGDVDLKAVAPHLNLDMF